MPGEIMTEVSAIVPGGAGDVLAAFAQLTRRPLPDGLVRTELLAAGTVTGRSSRCAVTRRPRMPCEPAQSGRCRCWVAGGLANGAVARRLSIWPHTASTHLRHVSATLGLPNRVAGTIGR